MLTILLGQVKLLSKIVVKLFVVSVVVDPTTRLTKEREEESRERKDRVSFVWQRHGGEEAWATTSILFIPSLRFDVRRANKV